MYYLSIINDLQIGYKSINAIDIVNTLFNDKIWLYTRTAPHISKITKGDKFILYIAGEGRRYFHSLFEIAGDIEKINGNEIIRDDNIDIDRFFEYFVPIDNINIFKKKPLIKDIKADLKFVKDKKNYGLFLRQSVKSISKEDYDYIISKTNLK